VEVTVHWAFHKFALSLCFLFLGLASNTFATVVSIDSLKTMALKSEVIVHAKVIDQRIKEDVEGRILTLTTLDVVDGLKNARRGDVLTVYQVGGELNGRVLRVSGAHNYRVDEELVLFGLSLDDMIVSYGVGLGKFKVIRDKKGDRVVEDLHDLVEVKSGKDSNALLEAPTARQYASLAQFKNAISEALHSSPGVVKRKPLKKKRGSDAESGVVQ
jgi:hypothetical protein